MTALAIDLLREVSEAGGTVRLEGDMLRLSAPAPLPDDLRARLRQHKAEVFTLLAATEPANDGTPVPVTGDAADLPTEMAEGVQAILDAEGARSIPPRRWPQIQRDTRRLVEHRWLHEALRVGWAAADLFGCDQRAPWYRVDRSGIVLLLAGAEIVDLDLHGAIMRTPTGNVLRYRRRPPAEPPVALLWEVLTSAGKPPAWPSPGATGPPIRRSTRHARNERMAATFLAGPRRHPDHERPSEEDHGCFDSARPAH